MGVFLTDLADACRASGLPVVEQSGWRTRGHGPLLGRPRAVVVHHTAGPKTGEAPSLRVVRDGRSDLPGPLAQLVLGRSGTVYVVAAGLAYHAGAVFSPATQGNGWSIGIEAEHDGVSAWPQVQYDAYVRLCAALCRWYGLGPDRVLGHKEVAKPAGRKSDPNFDCAAFRAAVATVLAPDQIEEDTMPTVQLPPTGPSGRSVTLAVPAGATELVISQGWRELRVESVAFFGPTPAQGVRQLWRSDPINLDPARPWQVRIPPGAVTAEINYYLEPAGDGEVEVYGVAACVRR